MRLPRPMRIAFTAPVLFLALAASPALAHGGGQDGPPPPPVDEVPAYHGQPYHPAQARPMMSPEARSGWLAECHARAGKHRKRYAADYCETYLDDYYARYSAQHPYYGYQGGYQGTAYPGATYGYAGGCCNTRPMTLVPIMHVQQPKPECKEVVEYEDVDVPARPARRSIPDKRVKIVPDKRVPVK